VLDQPPKTLKDAQAQERKFLMPGASREGALGVAPLLHGGEQLLHVPMLGLNLSELLPTDQPELPMVGQVMA
jgi:hypothetical protein